MKEVTLTRVTITQFFKWHFQFRESITSLAFINCFNHNYWDRKIIYVQQLLQKLMSNFSISSWRRHNGAGTCIPADDYTLKWVVIADNYTDDGHIANDESLKIANFMPFLSINDRSRNVASEGNGAQKEHESLKRYRSVPPRRFVASAIFCVE